MFFPPLFFTLFSCSWLCFFGFMNNRTNPTANPFTRSNREPPKPYHYTVEFGSSFRRHGFMFFHHLWPESARNRPLLSPSFFFWIVEFNVVLLFIRRAYDFFLFISFSSIADYCNIDLIPWNYTILLFKQSMVDNSNIIQIYNQFMHVGRGFLCVCSCPAAWSNFSSWISWIWELKDKRVIF